MTTAVFLALRNIAKKMDNADVRLKDSLESICYIFIFSAGA
jgi:hypothetical protein